MSTWLVVLVRSPRSSWESWWARQSPASEPFQGRLRQPRAGARPLDPFRRDGLSRRISPRPHARSTCRPASRPGCCDIERPRLTRSVVKTHRRELHSSQLPQADEMLSCHLRVAPGERPTRWVLVTAAAHQCDVPRTWVEGLPTIVGGLLTASSTCSPRSSCGPQERCAVPGGGGIPQDV